MKDNPRKRLNDWFALTSYHGRDCVAIFDVGTNAARVLVAPRKVPGTWAKGTFWNDSADPNPRVGQDIEENGVLDLRANSLAHLIHFIEVRRSWIRDHGVDDITLIATAWFRWLKNQDDVARRIEERTGLSIIEIPQAREAELTITSLPFIASHADRKVSVREGDLVFMLDQGGGSLEVSWMEWSLSEVRPLLGSHRIEKFGTVKLQRDFFNRTASGDLVNPNENRTGIKAQIGRVQRDAFEELRDNWSDKTSLLRGNRSVHVFAVGTAITNVRPHSQNSEYFSRSSHFIHGKSIFLSDVTTKLNDITEKYESVRSQVLTVHKKLNGLTGSGVERLKFSCHDIQSDLDLLSGLPIYSEIMKALGVDHVKIMGYPLRYGRYVWQYAHKKPLSPVRPDSSGSFVFVSYDREDRIILEAELAALGVLGVRVWWDEGLIAGEFWRPRLSEMIKKCSAFIFLLSPQSVNSQACADEIQDAISKQKPIIIIEARETELTKSVQPMYTLIRRTQRIQSFGMEDSKCMFKIKEALPESVLMK